MADADNVLINDRACVQFFGDVVTGRTNQFYAALSRLMVRARTGKRRQKAVVNIDDLANVLVTDAWRQNLHISCEHDGVGFVLFDNGGDTGEMFGLVVFIHGDMEKRNTVPFNHRAQIIVVGYHTGNVTFQLAAVPTVQQVGQTMALLTGHEDDFLRLATVADLPVHREFFGDGCKGFAQPIQAERQ